jgi:hypothetical protein
MSCLGSDITEQYLNKTYEDFSREQMRLMTAMKNGGAETEEKGKELDIQKQLTQLNTLMIGVLRFRNLRKNILIKGNSV